MFFKTHAGGELGSRGYNWGAVLEVGAGGLSRRSSFGQMGAVIEQAKWFSYHSPAGK